MVEWATCRVVDYLFSRVGEVVVMPKILCIASFVVSCIVFLLFFVDLILGVPFGNSTAGILVPIGFLLGSVIVGAFSVLTFLELR